MFRNKQTVPGFTLLVIFTLVLAACAPSTAAPGAMSPTNTAVMAPLPNTGATTAPTSAAPNISLTEKSNKDLGNILADSKGRTIYIFTKDTPNTSNCYDQCAAKWPPLIVGNNSTLSAGPGTNVQLSTTQRKDGSLQLTVNGMPVYYWFKDEDAEDVYGQGVGDVWFVLDSSGNIVKTPLPSAATTAPTTVPATTAAPMVTAEAMSTATASPTTAAVTPASTPLLKVGNSASLGKILTDNQGMTLYIFTVDQSGVSNCYDQCAQKWPPLLVDQNTVLNAGQGISAKLGTAQRKDGSFQLTVNNMPVYHWYQDTKPGDTNGQGVGSVWFVIDLSGKPITTSLASPGGNLYSP